MIQGRPVTVSSMISPLGLWGGGLLRQDGQLAEGKPAAGGHSQKGRRGLMEQGGLLWAPETTWIQPYGNSYFKFILE